MGIDPHPRISERSLGSLRRAGACSRQRERGRAHETMDQRGTRCRGGDRADGGRDLAGSRVAERVADWQCEAAVASAGCATRDRRREREVRVQELRRRGRGDERLEGRRGGEAQFRDVRQRGHGQAARCSGGGQRLAAAGRQDAVLARPDRRGEQRHICRKRRLGGRPRHGVLSELARLLRPDEDPHPAREGIQRSRCQRERESVGCRQRPARNGRIGHDRRVQVRRRSQRRRLGRGLRDRQAGTYDVPGVAPSAKIIR